MASGDILRLGGGGTDFSKMTPMCLNRVSAKNTVQTILDITGRGILTSILQEMGNETMFGTSSIRVYIDGNLVLDKETGVGGETTKPPFALSPMWAFNQSLKIETGKVSNSPTFQTTIAYNLY